MNKNRAVICEIISEMLDNPDENGIYPTTIAYNKLEDLVKEARLETTELPRAANGEKTIAIIGVLLVIAFFGISINTVTT